MDFDSPSNSRIIYEHAFAGRFISRENFFGPFRDKGRIITDMNRPIEILINDMDLTSSRIMTNIHIIEDNPGMYFGIK